MANRRVSRSKGDTQKTPASASIDELRLAGFRALADTRLELGDITVLIGRNGAGKSTLIDALEFVRDALADSLENALERRGGFASIRRQGADANHGDVLLAVQLNIFSDDIREVAEAMGEPFPDVVFPIPSAPEVPALYGFRLAARKGGKGFIVKEEVITLAKGKTHFRREIPFKSTATKVPAFARESLALPIIAATDPLARVILGVLRDGIRTYRLSSDALRAEPRVGTGSVLLTNGQNIGDVLAHLQRRQDIEWIVRHLQGVTPGIVGLRAGTAAGRRIVHFLQRGPRDTVQHFGVNDMSDGTLRCLGILLALRQPHVLTCIDEIEDSIHPAALAVLLDAVAATERVMFTSHSPEVLSHPTVTADRVRVVEWRDGASQVFRLGTGVEEATRPPSSVGKLLRSNGLWTADEPERAPKNFFGIV